MRKSVLRTLLVMFFVPLAGAVAIHAQPQQKKQRPSEPQTEEKLAREVRHQLILLPYYSVFDNLEFSVKDDVVTLAGQVVRPTLKSDAEAAVKSIEGLDDAHQLSLFHLGEGAADAERRDYVSSGVLNRSGDAARAQAVFLVIHGIAVVTHSFEFRHQPRNAGDRFRRALFQPLRTQN